MQEHREQKERLLLDFVKPTVETIESKGLLKTFHFFFEPNGFHFRVRANKREEVEEINEIVTHRLEKMNDLTFSMSEYTGEQGSYGTKGWNYAQKFFEYGCRISLLKKGTLRKLRGDPEASEEILKICKIPTEQRDQFFEIKFIHCFLNQMTFDILHEADFHLRGLFKDRIEVMRINMPELLRKTKSQWIGMLTELQSWISKLP
jgi:hypothetical protein